MWCEHERFTSRLGLLTCRQPSDNSAGLSSASDVVVQCMHCHLTSLQASVAPGPWLSSASTAISCFCMTWFAALQNAVRQLSRPSQRSGRGCAVRAARRSHADPHAGHLLWRPGPADISACSSCHSGLWPQQGYQRRTAALAAAGRHVSGG